MSWQSRRRRRKERGPWRSPSDHAAASTSTSRRSCRRGAADAGRARPLRGVRPAVPLALRPPLQLRAHVGPPRRVDLVRAVRRGRALRRHGLRARRPGAAGRRPDQLRGRPQGHGPVRHVGAARRSGRGGRPGAAARTAGAAPAPGGPPRVQAQPHHATPLFREFGARALDGHPTPATPFVKLSTGASGVGFASSIGLGIGAADRYGDDAPRVHIVEGEGGLTPGRVAEALAAAGTASLANVVVHLDWNQASIDSDRVCREGVLPGDYVQWDPRELFYLHDWNVIDVPDGHDFQQVVAAQRHARRARDRPADGDRLPHAQGLAVRRRGQGQPRRRAQALLRGLLRSRRGAEPHHRRRHRVAHLRPGRPRLRRAGRRGRAGALLLDGAAGRARPHPPGPADGGRAGAAPRGLPRPPRRARPGPQARRPARRRRLRARRGGGAGRARSRGDAGRPAPRARHLHHAPRRVRPRAAPPAGGQRRGVPRRRRRPRGVHQREHHRRRLRRRLLERAHQPGGAPALGRRDLRGRHLRRAQRHHRVWARPRRRLVLRRLHGAARAHRRAPARHRRPGEEVGHRRAVQAHVPRVRARRPQDRRGRPDARRPAAAAACCSRTSPRARRSRWCRGSRRRSGR